MPKMTIVLLLALALSSPAAGSESPAAGVDLTEEELAWFLELPPYPRGLVDIEAFRVAVVGLGKEAQQMGLTERVIRNSVELRLKGAGIRVIKEKTSESQFTPTLYINISAGPVKERDAFVVGLTVSVDRQVLIRPHGYPVEAQVWDAGYTGLVRTRDLVRVVRENLRKYVDELLTEYFTANPKTDESD